MFIGHYGVSLAAKRWAPELTATLLATPFLPPPDGPTGFAILALVSYAALAAIAARADHRRSSLAGDRERT